MALSILANKFIRKHLKVRMWGFHLINNCIVESGESLYLQAICLIALFFLVHEQVWHLLQLILIS